MNVAMNQSGTGILPVVPVKQGRLEARSTLLCEMNVAMSVERTHAFLVTNCDAVAHDDFADATKFQFRKLLFPRVE